MTEINWSSSHSAVLILILSDIQLPINSVQNQINKSPSFSEKSLRELNKNILTNTKKQSIQSLESLIMCVHVFLRAKAYAVCFRSSDFYLFRLKASQTQWQRMVLTCKINPKPQQYYNVMHILSTSLKIGYSYVRDIVFLKINHNII